MSPAAVATAGATHHARTIRRLQRIVQLLTSLSLAFAAALAARYGISYGWPDPVAAPRPLIPILIATLVAATGVATLMLRAYTGTTPRLRWLSIVYSVLCVLAIGVIWQWNTAARPIEFGFGFPVLDQAAVDAVVASASAAPGSGESDPVVVPTGVFLKSIEFTGANNVVVTGFVWQKYADAIAPAIEPGIILPEAIEERDAYPSTKAYRRRGPGYEVIG